MPPKATNQALSSRAKPKPKPRSKAKVVEESNTNPKVSCSLFDYHFMISDYSPVLDVSKCTSLHESDDEKPQPVTDEEELEVVDTKAPVKKLKCRSARKSTAAAKEVKEAKEAAAEEHTLKAKLECGARR